MITSSRPRLTVALLGGAAVLLAAGSAAAANGSAAPSSAEATRSPSSPSTVSVPSASSSAGSTSPGIRVSLPVTRTVHVSKAVPATLVAPATAVSLPYAGKTRTSFLDLDADGRLVALRTPKEPKGSDYSHLTKLEAVGFWKAGHLSVQASSSKETQGAMRGDARQVTAVVHVGHRLVWSETPSTDLDYGDWSIRTVDLKTHKVRQVAHSKAVKHGQVLQVTGGTYPVVIGDWVYWAASVPTVSDPKPDRAADWQFNVQRARLSKASAVQTVARNAVLPAALKGALVYTSYKQSKPDVYEIHRRDEPSGTDQVLVRGYRSGSSWITDLAASGRLVVWTVSSPSTAREGWQAGDPNPGVLFVLDTSTGALTRVETEDSAESASIAFTRRGVAWGSSSGDNDPGEYVLDTSTGAVQKLGKQLGLSEVLANPRTDVVMWATVTTKGTATVWHTGTLK